MQGAGVNIHILVAARADVRKAEEKADERGATGARENLVERILNKIEGLAGDKSNNKAAQQHKYDEQPRAHQQMAVIESPDKIEYAAGNPESHQDIKHYS